MNTPEEPCHKSGHVKAQPDSTGVSGNIRTSPRERSASFPQETLNIAVLRRGAPHIPARSQTDPEELCTHTPLHTVVLQLWRESTVRKRVVETKRTRTQQRGCVTFL